MVRVSRISSSMPRWSRVSAVGLVGWEDFGVEGLRKKFTGCDCRCLDDIQKSLI